ncbi:MAG: 16S rRNA (guanine(966)-N(2))-methyltransferase RsmD [Pseudomonadales bacterium]|nr:16S rRNA (guanine(966)-N(2))-methyltransferase RsmD [Pseudomonadales bacterium]
MTSSSNTVRIIGGKWKRRKLKFPHAPGLRPTMDRARETLFNWLAPHIHGSNCLDLYAGSGALGFEALSRGANYATLIDQNPNIVRALQNNRKILLADTNDTTTDNTYCKIIRASTPKWLGQQSQRWDIIFLDPPFGSPLLAQTLKILNAGQNCHDDTLVYIETPHIFSELSDWQTYKSSKVGGTHLTLLSRN